MPNKKLKNYLVIILLLVGVSVAAWNAESLIQGTGISAIADSLRLDDQEATIRAINKVKPAVVSIIVYDQETTSSLNTATGEITNATKKIKKGSGTGFLISPDGLIITNKHVPSIANEKTGEYRVILNSGKEYYAQFIGKDPLNDLAILKIFDKNLPFVELGNSDKIVPGTTVIAIGNAMGVYQNSVTKGIVSGLGRSISASDQTGQPEVLDNVIQTDAEINPGNSGGPLVDLNGKVVGISTAIDQQGTSIGFAIPINDARPVITSIKETGRIIRSRLGVHYIMLTQEIARDNNLPRNTGAWITTGDDPTPSVVPGSPAEKAGLQNGDIIYEVDGIKIQNGATLLGITQRYKPGKKIGFKIQRGDKTLVIIATLDEFK